MKHTPKTACNCPQYTLPAHWAWYVRRGNVLLRVATHATQKHQVIKTQRACEPKEDTKCPERVGWRKQISRMVVVSIVHDAENLKNLA